MPLRDTLARELTERFAEHELRIGAPPDPLAEFPAIHQGIGNLTMRADDRSYSVAIEIGTIFGTDFTNYDTHLDDRERAGRVTNEVMRFLNELFADRLLFWRVEDGRGSAWRERGESGPIDPLVCDNRVYHTYLWSRPLGTWRAIPVILGRGRIQSDREYEILVSHLRHPFEEDLDPAQREFAARLVAEYQVKD